MIPLFAVIGFRTRRQHILRLWLPLFLVWLLLLPLVLVLLPFACLACLVLRINPFAALSQGWALLSGLSGTHVEVEVPEHYILVRLI